MRSTGFSAPYVLTSLEENIGVVDSFGRRTDLTGDEFEAVDHLYKMSRAANSYWSGKGRFNTYMSLGGKDYTHKSLYDYLEGEAKKIYAGVTARHRNTFHSRNR